MSRTNAQLQGQVADLEAELRELRRTMQFHKMAAQRVCDTMRENDGKPHGDAMSVGAAWSALSYISGDNGPSPWAKTLETIKDAEVPK